MQKQKRIVLKISGEALSGIEKTGFDSQAIHFIAQEINDAVTATKTQLGIVLGGGNQIRGSQLATELGTTPVIGDQAGMLATVINGLILQDFLEHIHNLESRVSSAIVIEAFAKPYIRKQVISDMKKGRTIILTGGSGNPRFTTDTAAVLRTIELEADFIAKGTKVDGIYDKDPKKHDDAQFIDSISHHDFANKRLGIMDRTAITLAGENDVDIRIFNIFKKGNLTKLLSGESIGSLITTEK